MFTSGETLLQKIPYSRGPNFYRANRLWTWILNKTECAGICMPWRSVYLHPDFIDCERIRRHETQHVNQINRDGPWKWAFLVVYYVLRYGYTASPYEIDARAAESHDIARQ